MKSDFDSVIDRFESTTAHDLGDVYCAAIAYGQLHKPNRVRQLMMKMAASEVRTSIPQLLILKGYCISDRIDLAEALLNTWIESRVEKEQITSIHPSIQSLLLMTKSRTNTLKSSALAIEGLDVKFAFQFRLPWDAWSDLAAMYSQRMAWRQCVNILCYLEDTVSRGDGSIADDSSNDADSISCQAQISAALASTVDMTYMKSHSIGGDEKEVLVAVYIHTLAALCGAHQVARPVFVQCV